MNEFRACLLFLAAIMTVTGTTQAQIVAIDGSHRLEGSISHLIPGQPPWSDEFDQTLFVTTLGSSEYGFLLLDNIFDSSIMMHSEWETTGNSVIGTVSKAGHIDYDGPVENNKNPRYTSFAHVEFTVILDAAGTPFRFTIDWNMLPIQVTGDGWGYNDFAVTVGDEYSNIRYGLIAESSLDNVDPKFGPTGTFVIEGLSLNANLKFRIFHHGRADMIQGCSPLVCSSSSVDTDSFVSYELLVGDAALEPDSDSDNIADSADNCTVVPNADQYDSDGDGYGNLCDPDLDNNGTVNFSDYSMLAVAFLSTPASPNWNPDADLNNDGLVNFGDIAIIPSYFLMPPGPSGTAP